MPDIIFHIGLAKCASTTLQNHVFRGEKGFLGTCKGLSKSDNYAKQFKAFSPVSPRQWSNLKAAKRWVTRIKSNHPENIQRFILSEEGLSKHNKLFNRPIIPFIEKFSNSIWTDGQVKIVLVIRNYAERMASDYAQVAVYNPIASQSDFEQHIYRHLRLGKTHDYSKWVTDLYNGFGKENVCVLLMEEIGKNQFWERLNDFCQLEYFQPNALRTAHENSKRKGKDTWSIRPFDPIQKGKVTTNNIFGFAWPSNIVYNFRQHSMEFTKQKISSYYARKYYSANNNRETEIKLTESLRHQIQEYYSESTEQLSNLLGKDMAALGY